MSMAQSVAPIVCPGHSRPIVDIRFRRTSEDSLDLLISACHDKTSQLRWADNGAWIGTYKGHNGAVWSSALDDSGQRALTGSADFSAKLWNATTGEEMASFPHDHVVKAVDFSLDSNKFLSAGLEKKAHVYDIKNKARITTFVHPAQVSKALWLSENTFISGGYDSILRTWDVREPPGNTASAITLEPASKKGVADIQFIPDQNAVITCLGRKILIFDLKTQKPKLEISVKFDVEAASLSPNGQKVVAGGSDLWLHVFELSASTSAEEVSVHKGHHGPIFCTRWDTEGKSFASGSEDGTIRIWPVSSIV